MSARGGSIAGLGKTRIEALTDGIFATVMTILGLSLTLPYITGPLNQPLPDFTEVLTGVLIYALSFFIIGVFWVGHHMAFHYVRRTDRTLIWLNNVFLLFIGLLPLTTALLGRHDLERVTLLVYGLNLLAVQLSLYATFWYATVHHHLVDANLNDAIIRSGRRRILLGPFLSSTAIILSFVAPLASLGAYVVFPVVFVLPGRIDAFSDVRKCRRRARTRFAGTTQRLFRTASLGPRGCGGNACPRSRVKGPRDRRSSWKT